MSNSYLMGAMLDPLVVEFMSPAYREGMLEAKIRTDEIRGNCPPRAGFVCVLDPRVKTGRYYRKQVAGEGVNALPPSRIEKALAQQEQRSQKGEGISFLGKAAIAGGLAVGGLAAIGAIANSGRSTEPVPDIPNTKKPDTSVKPKSSTYEEARESVRQKVKQKIDPDIPDVPYAEPRSLDDEIEEEIKRGWDETEKLRKELGMPPSERNPYAANRKRGGNPKSANEIQAEIDNALDENDQIKKRSKSSGATTPTSPEAAKRKRGQPTVNDVDTVIQKLETLKQVAKVAAVPSVATVAVGAAAITQKTESLPVLNGIKPKKMTDFPEAVASGLAENLSRTNDLQKTVIVDKASKGFSNASQFDVETARELGLSIVGDLNKYLGYDREGSDDDAVTAVRVMYGLDGQKVSPVPLTNTTQVTPNPEVTATPKAKKKSEPPIDTTTAQGLSHTTIRDGYAAIADVAGKQNIGYKSAAQLRQKLGEGGVIRSGRMADNKADFEALLDNNMLVEKGYLVQTKAGYGGYGKDNVGMVRVPAFMPVKDLSSATSNILSEGKGGAGITDRIERTESLVAAINEKMNKAEDLTDTEREQLAKNRESLNAKIGIDKAKIQKGSAIAETNKPAGQPPKLVVPEFESPAGQKIAGMLGGDIKAIAKYFKGMGANEVGEFNKLAAKLPPKDAEDMAEYLDGLNFGKLAGAANNRNAIVRGLRKPPAIAEKPPVPPAPIVNAETYDLKPPASANAVAASTKARQAIREAAQKAQRASDEIAKQTDRIKANADDLKRQLDMKEIDADAYNNAIRLARQDLDDKGYFKKVSPTYAQLDDEIKGLLGIDEYRRNGNWTNSSVETQSLAYEKLEEIKNIERLTYKELGLNTVKDPDSKAQLRAANMMRYPKSATEKANNPSAPKPPVEKSVEKSIEAIAPPPATPPVETSKQAEVKVPKAKKEKSSKKQAPKPEDFPIDIPTIKQNVKIMENDLQKNEGRLEALRRQSVSQPEKVAMLEKIIEKQKKEIQDKQQEVFDYIQSLSKKQNNDAIAPHETYYSAKEQAKRDALRRFAA